eukprot:TRINITY_DN24781_c0_g1_i1.p1 TRINITY_DN24781_c0_g1~~TRINITY_DN24781_c0_g1_i1.p1  ORF type:complete len:152 (-),score=8.77 TRINITY_DN24781_c0_g1_i1:215-670(-)
MTLLALFMVTALFNTGWAARDDDHEQLSLHVGSTSMLDRFRTLRSAMLNDKCAPARPSSLIDVSDASSGLCPSKGPSRGCGCNAPKVKCKCQWFEQCYTNGLTSNWDAFTQSQGICKPAMWIFLVCGLPTPLLFCWMCKNGYGHHLEWGQH